MPAGLYLGPPGLGGRLRIHDFYEAVPVAGVARGVGDALQNAAYFSGSTGSLWPDLASPHFNCEAAQIAIPRIAPTTRTGISSRLPVNPLLKALWACRTLTDLTSE